ncbi:MAG: amino acid ABC transporter substrate-binding protein [Selenomonadaceae bacterium]|nr:amino acid ABC transporter substrate-binding protein [Selenomonadaceae bacterium]
MKKILFYALLITNCALLLAGCGGNKNLQDDAENDFEKLIIGLDDAYPPFGFRDENNEIIGFDIDLANEVADRIGVEIEFKGIDWNKKYEELDGGLIDVIWSGFNITPEREEHVIFTKPYMLNRQVILVAKGNKPGIVTASDLAGKVVGTQLSSPADDFINKDKELKDSFAKLVTYDNYKHAFEALSKGEVEAIVCDELVVRYEMSRHHDKFETVEATIGTVTEIGVGFRKKDTALRDRVQSALDEIIKDGTAEKISEEWFQADLIRTHIR